ncbi:hypothetical protein BbiDN127_H0005 (plasmid) [Borreliella bissettiae DN127]|uniref:Uncharacterized protein n=1 Tax=Borrelia bissettiae (strain DSM 17990 / CIP 109136 / DN127) TaxID=521010 RepID=G0AP40_BORBD|nr:hypothetical protein BbiDN127_H0005 [Borreliella bissettiae DN127]
MIKNQELEDKIGKVILNLSFRIYSKYEKEIKEFKKKLKR